ncbi:MAG: hypothetical protein DDT18_00361 [Actinobacteria bacterium]|nr:hypothetical protein [Actinomycetota bacterium]
MSTSIVIETGAHRSVCYGTITQFPRGDQRSIRQKENLIKLLPSQAIPISKGIATKPRMPGKLKYPLV